MLDMAKVSMRSLLKLHPDARILAFTIGLSSEKLSGMKVTQYNFKDVPALEHSEQLYTIGFIKSSILRLVAMDYLKSKETSGRFLYVDADTMFSKPIDHMWDIDMGDNWLGAVEEFFEKFGHEYGIYEKEDDCYHYRMQINPKYFNSGVLLFDLDKMPEGLYSTFKNIDNKHIIFKDQDVLNMISKEYHQLDTSYNAFYNFHFHNVIGIDTAINEYIRLDSAHIVHFIGWEKPHHKGQPINYKTMVWPMKKYIEIASEINHLLPPTFLESVIYVYENSGKVDELITLRNTN